MLGWPSCPVAWASSTNFSIRPRSRLSPGARTFKSPPPGGCRFEGLVDDPPSRRGLSPPGWCSAGRDSLSLTGGASSVAELDVGADGGKWSGSPRHDAPIGGDEELGLLVVSGVRSLPSTSQVPLLVPGADTAAPAARAAGLTGWSSELAIDTSLWVGGGRSSVTIALRIVDSSPQTSEVGVVATPHGARAPPHRRALDRF